MPGLLFDDAVKIERARLQDYSDQSQAQRQLVRNHLRRRTQSAHQAVLVIRRPAGERDAVNTDRRHAKHIQQRDVEARDHQLNRADETAD